MTTTLNPYLNFRGAAREALAFYQEVFGGDVSTMTYADMGVMGLPEEHSAWVMHGQLTTGDGLTLMGADVPPSHQEQIIEVAQIALSGGPEDEELLRTRFARLCEGGQMHVPLEKAPWGDWFGMCADRYGQHWMINIAGEVA